MGVFDSFRQGDRGVQDALESVAGRAARTAGGVAWPLACDPDGSHGGFDILRSVASPRHPHRYRAESADANGYELREHEATLTYDGLVEHRHRMSMNRVVWVEVLHRPAWDDDDLFLVRDQYDTSLRWDEPRSEADGRIYPSLDATDPITGQHVLLLWLAPAVLRFRQADVRDVDDVRSTGTGFLYSEFLVELLRTVDHAELARWAEAVAPFRDTVRETSMSRGALGGAIRGAMDALLHDREGTTADGGGSGGLLGRVLGSAKDGANAGSGAAAVNALRSGKLGGVLKKAMAFGESRQRDPGRDVTLPTLTECSQRPPAGTEADPWVAVDPAALAQVVGGVLGADTTPLARWTTADWDVFQLRAGGGEAHVALVAGTLDDCHDEVSDQKTVGEWLLGDSGGDVAVGAFAGNVLMVRLVGAGNPLKAMQCAKAVAEVLSRR